MSQTSEIEKREQDRQDNPDVVFTNKSIEDSKVKSLKDYRNDVLEAAINYVLIASEPDHEVREAILNYHTALRKADRDRK